MNRQEDLSKVFDRTWNANHNDVAKRGREREVKFMNKMFQTNNFQRKEIEIQKVTPGMRAEALQNRINTASNIEKKIKSELEDLSLRYLKPDVFYDIVEKLNTTKLERDNAVSEMINTVSDMLKEHNIKFDIKGRSKSIYSIYKKMEKGKKFSDLYDLLALRVLVETEQDCYTVLGIIHSKFRPIPKRFK